MDTVVVLFVFVLFVLFLRQGFSVAIELWNCPVAGLELTELPLPPECDEGISLDELPSAQVTFVWVKLNKNIQRTV